EYTIGGLRKHLKRRKKTQDSIKLKTGGSRNQNYQVISNTIRGYFSKICEIMRDYIEELEKLNNRDEKTSNIKNVKKSSHQEENSRKNVQKKKVLNKKSLFSSVQINPELLSQEIKRLKKNIKISSKTFKTRYKTALSLLENEPALYHSIIQNECPLVDGNHYTSFSQLQFHLKTEHGGDFESYLSRMGKKYGM
ncbi:MAG: hypothetical protein ACFFCS_25495, partial [Candidatus Hodarchaeota archaeon]